jgi:hypothetical protein
MPVEVARHLELAAVLLIRGRPRARISATRWANRSLAISRRLGTNDKYVTLCSLANGVASFQRLDPEGG